MRPCLRVSHFQLPGARTLASPRLCIAVEMQALTRRLTHTRPVAQALLARTGRETPSKVRLGVDPKRGLESEVRLLAGELVRQSAR